MCITEVQTVRTCLKRGITKVTDITSSLTFTEKFHLNSLEFRLYRVLQDQILIFLGTDGNLVMHYQLTSPTPFCMFIMS